jgi:hypothetical protein
LKEVAIRNYFAHLRTADMDTDSSGAEARYQEEAVPAETCRPPFIVIATATNLIQLQKRFTNVTKEIFEFCNTSNGTRVITKTLADFTAVRSHLESRNPGYFTFHPKSLKPIKAVIRHLPLNTPAEDISKGLMNLGFDIISVKQMSTTHRSPSQGTISKNLPIFLITFSRMANCRFSDCQHSITSKSG